MKTCTGRVALRLAGCNTALNQMTSGKGIGVPLKFAEIEELPVSPMAEPLMKMTTTSVASPNSNLTQCFVSMLCALLLFSNVLLYPPPTVHISMSDDFQVLRSLSGKKH